MRPINKIYILTNELKDTLSNGNDHILENVCTLQEHQIVFIGEIPILSSLDFDKDLI